MPRFEFGLEGVLRHRRNIERDRQRLLATAQLQMQQLKKELRELDVSAQQVSEDLRQHGLIGRLDMNYIAAHRRFAASIQRKGTTLMQRMVVSQRQIDAATAALAEAAKQRKIMEKLEEKQKQRWLAEQDRRQTAELDEIGMQVGNLRLAIAGGGAGEAGGEA